MNELGLKITRPYKNVCGIDSRAIRVRGLIKNLEVFLANYRKVAIITDVLVIDVPNA